MKRLRSIPRRDFLKKVPLALAGMAGFPTIIKASALGKDGAVPASDRIVMAGIGYGMQGPGDMQNFLGKNEVQWVAVCDIDQNHLAQARDAVNRKYGNKDCATYKDFCEMFSRTDLDAISMASSRCRLRRLNLARTVSGTPRISNPQSRPFPFWRFSISYPSWRASRASALRYTFVR
jgi:hypothetical protein